MIVCRAALRGRPTLRFSLAVGPENLSLYEEVAEILSVLPDKLFQFENTPKALTNLSPEVGAWRQPWDRVMYSVTTLLRVRQLLNPFRI